MPKSRLKKGHKKRVQNYLNQKRAAEKKAKKILMEQYQKLEEERLANSNAQKAGETLENADINVDLDIDDMEIDDIIVDGNNEIEENNKPTYELTLPSNGKVGDIIDLIINTNDSNFDNSKISEVKLSNKRITVNDDNTKLNLVKPGLCKITVYFFDFKLKSEIEVLSE